MPPVLCKALLFDLDGVLVDSTPAVAPVWTWWARQYGFDPDEIVHKAHGRPCIATIRELLPNADHEAESREVERREILDVDGVIPLPGVRELLDSLPADRWTIVTSCTTPLAHVRIRAAGLTAPSRMVTADDITRGKPDPEPCFAAWPIRRRELITSRDDLAQPLTLRGSEDDDGPTVILAHVS